MLAPMLATLADPPLEDPQLVYEPKYDGIRAIADVPAGGRGVRLWSRLGNEKTRQFPEVVAALERWAKRRTKPAVLDGEIVALDEEARPSGFQQLQNRIHLTQGRDDLGPTAYILFDLLREGAADLRDRPLRERRAALERVFERRGADTLRLSEVSYGDGRPLYERALASGWEGLIAKRLDSKYYSGRRTPDWRKLKLTKEQEFVVGGWTEPRNTRSHFGALLLGVYEAAKAQRDQAKAPRELIYVGHTGTGFNERELTRLTKLMSPLERPTSPFAERPRTNERAHWTEPKLVAQVRFTEWTADDRLRHPVYLGLRDDKKAEDVVREKVSPSRAAARLRVSEKAPARSAPSPIPALLERLRALEDGPGEGSLELPDGRVDVTNLRKIFWPKQKLTKGDLFRYYVKISPYILPAVADRPLVMKRFPNGIAAKPFYQHRVENPTIPPGVRVERVAAEDKRSQLIGGSLATLLYCAQLAAISQDPWFSRVRTPAFADHVALDLDPSEGVNFSQVLDVARWVHDELQALGGTGVPKTSGSRGLHIYLPLPPKTPYEAGLLLCQIIATVVADKHPKHATIERSVRARGRRVYVDYLQNIMGKTLASAYSARASEYAGVSTPLTWDEIEQGVGREEFTITTTPARFKEVGDLWAALRQSKGIDLNRVLRYATRGSSGSRGSRGARGSKGFPG
jgi:bifunctional non-homologous end joining protein LigD